MTRLLIVSLCLPIIALGEESSIRLKDAPGRELVAAKCAICHSLDYIAMNSPFLDLTGWEKELDKMVKLGAPISENETPILLRYLKSQYGR